MLLIADTHVHLYDGYDLDRAFSSAFANLARLKAAAAQATTAPARTRCSLPNATTATPSTACASRRAPGGSCRHRLAETPDAEVMTVTSATGETLYLVAGRQIVTRERLEVLALATPGECPTAAIYWTRLRAFAAVGGVPVLAWAPGKWLGRRGRVVQSVLRESEPSGLLVGDTSMRPRGWATPRLMREAGRRWGSPWWPARTRFRSPARKRSSGAMELPRTRCWRRTPRAPACVGR